MFKPTHIISPADATGQYVARESFAYKHSGAFCILVGAPYYCEAGPLQGFRQMVRLVDGTEGYVWEDEIGEICNGCVGCWQCD